MKKGLLRVVLAVCLLVFVSPVAAERVWGFEVSQGVRFGGTSILPGQTQLVAELKFYIPSNGRVTVSYEEGCFHTPTSDTDMCIGNMPGVVVITDLDGKFRDTLGLTDEEIPEWKLQYSGFPPFHLVGPGLHHLKWYFKNNSTITVVTESGDMVYTVFVTDKQGNFWVESVNLDDGRPDDRGYYTSSPERYMELVCLPTNPNASPIKEVEVEKRVFKEVDGMKCQLFKKYRAEIDISEIGKYNAEFSFWKLPDSACWATQSPYFILSNHILEVIRLNYHNYGGEDFYLYRGNKVWVKDLCGEVEPGPYQGSPPETEIVTEDRIVNVWVFTDASD